MRDRQTSAFGGFSAVPMSNLFSKREARWLFSFPEEVELGSFPIYLDALLVKRNDEGLTL